MSLHRRRNRLRPLVDDQASQPPPAARCVGRCTISDRVPLATSAPGRPAQRRRAAAARLRAPAPGRRTPARRATASATGRGSPAPGRAAAAPRRGAFRSPTSAGEAASGAARSPAARRGRNRKSRPKTACAVCAAAAAMRAGSGSASRPARRRPAGRPAPLDPGRERGERAGIGVARRVGAGNAEGGRLLERGPQRGELAGGRCARWQRRSRRPAPG